MGFLAIVNTYTMRACLSITITEMVHTNFTDPNHALAHANNTDGVRTNLIDHCPIDHVNSSHESYHRYQVTKFDWNEELQGIILGSFYIGYVITHLPGALLCEYFGGKYVLCLGILSTAIFSVITPLVTEAGGAPGLIILRILMGLGEGTTFPALSSLIAAWVPKKERGKLGSCVFGGGQVRRIPFWHLRRL